MTPPTRFGRQCRMNTWTIHSKNGNSASITSGHDRVGDLPVADDDPRGHRADNGDANHPRGGCFQNSRRASASVNPFAYGARRSRWSSVSSRSSRALSSAVVAGSSRSCAACLARSGIARGDRVGQLAIRLRAADLVGHHDGQRGQRGFVGGAQRVVHQPECDRIRAVDNVVPERQCLALLLDGIVLAGQRAQRFVEQRRPVRGRAAGRPARRPWDRCAGASRGCCARPPGRVRRRG